MSTDSLKRLTQGLRLNLSAVKGIKEKPKTIIKKRKHEDPEGDGALTLPPTKKTKKTLSEEKLAQMHKEEVRHLQNRHQIHVREEDDLPDPIETFDDLVERYGMSNQLRGNIPYDHPTPVQMQAIPALMERRELLALAPTGSGKTAAFAIPVLHHLENEKKKNGLKAVFVVPTRELAKQMYREVCKLCLGLDVTPHLLNSDLDTASSAADLLVTTPKRLVFLLQQDPCPYKMTRVKWLVIDECDKLFEVKHEESFRDQLATIYKACCGKKIRRALFSATYMSVVETWAKEFLNSPAVFYIGQKNVAASTVKQEILFCGQDTGKELALEQLIKGGYTPPVLVFVNTRDRVRVVHKIIHRLEPRAQFLHSQLPDSQRDMVLEQFADGHIPILVCTDVFSWGMDFNISLVVNYDVPRSLRSYVNRIGRSGRAGRPGRAITYFNQVEFVDMTAIAKTIRASGAEVPDYLLEENKVSALKRAHKMKQEKWKKQKEANQQQQHKKKQKKV